MKELQENMKVALADYMKKIKDDYKAWWLRVEKVNDVDELSSNIKQMIADFDDKVRYEAGRSYVKVITGTSVHSFIVVKESGKFMYGDALKAASWSAPAKNFARGNIFGIANPQWTGI